MAPFSRSAGSTPSTRSRARPFGLTTVHLQPLLPAVLLLLAFALRVWQLDRTELWFDETASTFVAQKSLAEIVRYTATAPGEHPPLYYWLLHLWTGLVGESEYAIRFLSVLLNVLFVASLGLLGRRLRGRRFALVVMALVIVSPFVILHAQEARMYSLVMVLATWFLWALERVEAGRPRAAYGLGLIAIAGSLTSYFFAPLVGAGLLVLAWRRGPHAAAWLGLALPAVAVGGLLVLPGPRSTLVRLWLANGGIGSWPGKIAEAMRDIGGQLDGPHLTLLPSLITWGIVAVGAWRWRHRPSFARFALVFLAPLALVAVLPVLDGRYLSAALPVTYLWLAAGVIDLWRRVRYPAAWLLPLLGVGLLLPTWQHYHRDSGYFGAALAAATAAIQSPEQDLLLIPEPDAWPLLDFYARDLPIEPRVVYLPAQREVDRVGPDEVAAVLDPLLAQSDRIVLGPIGAQNRDPDFLIENYLLDEAYAVSRTFWPDSTMVALFVTPRGQRAGPADLRFGERLRLRQSDLSPLQVAQGGAITARLQWEALADELPRLTVGLQLQGPDGLVWASQQTEPCSGWCDSPSWRVGEPVIDNRALIIPSDTPPGPYTLLLRVDSEAGAVGVPQPLGQVEVTLAAEPRLAVGEPEARLGEVAVRDVRVGESRVRAGDELAWSAQWDPSAATAPTWRAVWELWQGDEVRQRWVVAPAPVPYDSPAWPRQRVLRGQGRLLIPGDLAAGEYLLRLRVAPSAEAPPTEAALPVAPLTVVERPHRYEVPPIGERMDLAWQQGVRLRRALLPSQASAGEAVPLTLVWQAEGPTDRSYKFFVHLRDAANQTVTQVDRYPAGGQAPSTSWVPSEVLVEEAALALPADVPPGPYNVVVGFYHEATGERLPLAGRDGDEATIGTLVVSD